MANVFDRLLSTNFWLDESEFELKYSLPENHKPSTKNSLHAKYEDASGELYSPEGRMSTFKVRTAKRFMAWIKTFANRYHNQLGELHVHDYTSKWLDKVKHDKGPIVEIFIQLYKGGSDDDTITKKESNTILTFHLYPKTFVITVQISYHQFWADNEFSYLKSIVYSACDENNLDVGELDTIIDLENSQTDVKVISIPNKKMSVKQ